MWEVIQGNCVDAMRGMADASVDAVVTDPPYFRVKGDDWDNQWSSGDEFIAWLATVADEWRRLLKPNGSLYCFASPQMAARVEVMLSARFNVLNRITWSKAGDDGMSGAGRHRGACKEDLRSFFPATEAIIFAEHHGADTAAMGVSGYGAKCDELRGFVFEPLRAYLDGERERAGVSTAQIVEWFGSRGFPKYVTARHSFSKSQWDLPTKENYARLRECFAELSQKDEYLRREYEDLRREYEDLRREYEDLRREYEDLRRPFFATPDTPYTDVWTFPTVAFYDGKHPCEKPLDMMRHIVETSTRPGAVVLDSFCGSGSTGVACVQTGRSFVGVEMDSAYCEIARDRLARAVGGDFSRQVRRTMDPNQLALF